MATKSLKRRLQDANERYGALRDEIYAAASNNTTPFAQCLALVSATLRDAYLDARSKCEQIEVEAVAAGKAHRTRLGTLAWYQ